MTYKHAIQKYLCEKECTIKVVETVECEEGTWSYEEFIATYPSECDFSAGTWKITIETLFDIPDEIEETIISLIDEFFDRLVSVEIIESVVEGTKIEIKFKVEGTIIPILLLILAIGMIVTISLITIEKIAEVAPWAIGGLLIIGILIAAAEYEKRRKK